MMKAAFIAALSIPVFSATAGDFAADYAKSREQAEAWQTSFTRLEEDLKALGVDLQDSTESAEIPETKDTVATADKGLFFDTANSTLVYLGNVRLRDSRANINASNQLHIYMQELMSKSEEDKPSASEPAPKAAPKPAPNAPASTTPEAAATVTELAAKIPATVPVQAKTPSAPQEEPALINTHSAVADSVNNNIFLYSPAGGQEILLQQGKNIVRITPKADAPARILADPQGNIMLEGALVDLCMVDKEGAATKLKSSGGLVFYHASTHTLHAPGSAEFSHPDGTLSCTDGLCIILTPAATQEPQKKGFMSQFAGLRFEGIDTATATGNVVMTGAATDGRQALRAEGDTLSYNGKTGECSLQGTKCRLNYGEYDVYSNEGLHLLANGDIELRGTDIHGTYERESDTPGQLIKGTFKAYSLVAFRADQGTIFTEKGLAMADSEGDFSCTGPAHLVLSPKEGAGEPKQQKPGLPNLAIARFGEVTKARAIGNVTAHRFEPGTGKCISELKAHSVETDLVSGETLLQGEVDKPLIAQHETSRIEAIPAAGKTAAIQIQANGDMQLTGERITATMKNEDGTTTARCKDYVRLIRAEDRLETGSSTELHAPTAILTTNGNLSAKLTSTGNTSTPQPPRKPGLGGFRFNYNGISEATTRKGCTLRTEQGSMQCTGPVRLVMDAEAEKKDGQMGGLKYATASGNVAVAGKDSTGRLLRATGDLLTIDATTGVKELSGQRVTLGDAHNTHIITGKGAAIRIDAKNNVKISGGKHTTHATNVRQQLNNSKNTKTKK